MPFEMQGNEFTTKPFCAQKLKFMDREPDGTWMMYFETKIDVPRGQTRLAPVDVTEVVWANDKYHHVYKRVPVQFPCNKFTHKIALVMLARSLANTNFKLPWE